jgi:hypothetical protein
MRSTVTIRTLLLAALVVLSVARPSPAQTPKGVEILSPKPDGLETSRTLRVRVRIRGEVAGFHIYLRGHDFSEVTDRFGPSRRGVRTARFSLDRDLVRGANHVFVQVQRPSGAVESEEVHFTAARRLRGMLALGVRVATREAPLTVRVRAPRATDILAKLNGRDAQHLFQREGAGRWIARLAANDRLRFGPNRLSVAAFNAQGEYERVHRTVEIERSAPLVGAGRDRTVRAGQLVQIDGGSTRSARPGGALRMSWQIVSRPEGSTATLSRATGTRPSLRPDVPGRYTIRLHASEAGSDSATDTLTIAAQPDVLPAGIPVRTMISPSSPGILVGETIYPSGAGWLQMLVLDRGTLEEIQNQTYPGTDQGMSALESDVGTLSFDDLVILTPGGQTASLSTSAQATLAGVLNGLGAIFQPGTGSASQLGAGQWSLIGIPQLPQGLAYQNIGLQLDPSAPVGGLTGFFQLDTSSNYTFTWPPSFIPFDTQAPGTTSEQNVITVGSQTYTSAPIVGQFGYHPGGFHVVWLDSGSLELRGEYTAAAGAPVDSGCGVGSLLCMDGLAMALQPIVSSGLPRCSWWRRWGSPPSRGRTARPGVP